MTSEPRAGYIQVMTKAFRTLLEGFGTLRLDPSAQLGAYRQKIAREDEHRRNEVLRSLYLASLRERASIKHS